MSFGGWSIEPPLLYVASGGLLYWLGVLGVAGYVKARRVDVYRYKPVSWLVRGMKYKDLRTAASRELLARMLDGRLDDAGIEWVVEQAHACLGRSRRLSKDYERQTSSSETWVQISAIQRMLRRLRPDERQRQAAFKYPKKSQEAA